VKVIDAHLHFSDIESMRTAAKTAGIEYSVAGLRREQDAAAVVLGVCMGINERGLPRGRHKMSAPSLCSSPNPMLPDLTSPLPENMVWCVGVNPVFLRGEHTARELDRLDAALADARAVGVKLYPGYFPYTAQHAVYEPVYDLAAQHRVPVVVHGGETFVYGGDDALAHPQHVDAAAGAHPALTFVLAHMGYPWVAEAAAAARRRSNIVIELSGLVEGGAAAVEVARHDREDVDLLRGELSRFGDYDRVIFGTDWPLVPVGDYLGLIAELTPEQAHEKVFFDNAARVFARLQRFL